MHRVDPWPVIPLMASALLLTSCTIAQLPDEQGDVTLVPLTNDAAVSTPSQPDGAGSDDSAGVSDAEDATTPEAGCDWAVSLNEVPSTAGTAYVSHFGSSELSLFRFDGGAPVGLGTMDLGALTHDMALHAADDLLIVALDLIGEVRIYALNRPASPDALLLPPSLISTIVFPDSYPLQLAVDPDRDLLIVAASPWDALVGEDTQTLYVYDVSNPAAPELLREGGTSTSASSGIALDGSAGILALTGLYQPTLELRDLTTPSLPILGGTPPDTNADFAADGASVIFRTLALDQKLGRALLARGGGESSEVAAYAYPPVSTVALDPCPSRPDHDSLTLLPDFFDLSVASADRPTLQELHNILIDQTTGNGFIIADAEIDGTTQSLVVPLGADLQPGPACLQWENIACNLQVHAAGSPVGVATTDGAACYDPDRDVLLVTSHGATAADPGSAHFFQVATDLSMNSTLPAGGDTLGLGLTPIAAICH